jgi:dUTP pyrophosphatase
MLFSGKMIKGKSMSLIEVQIKLLPHALGIPSYGSADAAGMDLCACIPENITIEPGKPSVLVPTGVAVFIRNSSYTGLIVPRSGLGHKQGLNLGNSSGIIDADYQNELFVSLFVRTGHNPLVIKPGDRIAQMLIIPVMRANFKLVEEFEVETARGLGGFGSTGVN